jgi:hypothetical protein
MLDIFQFYPGFAIQRFRKQQPNETVEFVHGAHGFDTEALLGRAGTVPQAGGSVITGPRINPGQSLSHTDCLINLRSDFH